MDAVISTHNSPNKIACECEPGPELEPEPEPSMTNIKMEL